MSGPLPLLRRVPVGARRPVPFTLDGRPCEGFEGDTVLVAVLAQAERLREHEVDATPRAGFCAIGACQDCWMSTDDGHRLRACTTPLSAGLALRTGAA